MNLITEEPLDTGRLFAGLAKHDSGSVIFHFAVVKGRAGDKSSAGIRCERDGDMEAEMTDIEKDIRERWPIDDLLLARRLGLLPIGELISLVAVSAAASDDAFAACRYGLSRIRKMASIKKTELFTG